MQRCHSHPLLTTNVWFHDDRINRTSHVTMHAANCLSHYKLVQMYMYGALH